VADSLPRVQWFESPLEQFVLKTRAVNSILGNRNIMGKIPSWWENSDRGNRKTAGKNFAMVGNFPQWEKKSLPLHGSFSTAAPVLYAGNYLPLFSQCRIKIHRRVSSYRHRLFRLGTCNVGTTAQGGGAHKRWDHRIKTHKRVSNYRCTFFEELHGQDESIE
jgi:hypothetical protein